MIFLLCNIGVSYQFLQNLLMGKIHLAFLFLEDTSHLCSVLLQISKLEAKKGVRGREEELEVIVEDEDEDEEIIDIENTSSVTINQKF